MLLFPALICGGSILSVNTQAMYKPGIKQNETEWKLHRKRVTDHGKPREKEGAP